MQEMFVIKAIIKERISQGTTTAVWSEYRRVEDDTVRRLSNLIRAGV